jgi:tripartite-type tricarboxylate transporter receptor subunit TctC
MPTIAQTINGYQRTSWLGGCVPAGTPRPIVDQSYAELRIALADAAVAAKLSAQVRYPVVKTPEAFAKPLQFDSDRLRQGVKMSRARIEWRWHFDQQRLSGAGACRRTTDFAAARLRGA